MNASTSAKNVVKNATDYIAKQDFTNKESPFFWILLITTIALIVYFIHVILKFTSTVSTPTNVANITSEQIALYHTKFTPEFKDKKTLFQAIQGQSISERENCLINFQPLTVIHPGFLGPVRDGVYDEKEGVSTALRMGARCFVLPIDYHDNESMPPTFPPANKPCLLFRDEGGSIRSINAGSIAKVAQTIADVAWSDILIQKNDPFILILYFVRTPQQNTRAYLDFLSDVASQLAPLSPYLLGQTPDGVYNRQAREDQLLYVDTSKLEKKLLIFCNTDTSGFRTSAKDYSKTYPTKEDLDYWVHMRVYKQNIETPLGVTTVIGSAGVPRAMVEKTSYYTNLPSDQSTKQKAIDGTKEKFMITLSPEGRLPEGATATVLLDTYGVQSVPLLLIDYSSDVQVLLNKWKYAWRAKPKEIRYVRPIPQTVKVQSPATNANGGSLANLS